MINTCFEYQHSELFGRPEVVPEFPRESAVGAEPLPEGFNSEGYVFPELMVGTAVSVDISYEWPAAPRGEPRFQEAVILAAHRLASCAAEQFLVRFRVVCSCCGCAEHVAAEIGRRPSNQKPFALVHCARDRTKQEAPMGQLVVTGGRGYRREQKLPLGAWDPEHTAEELQDLLFGFFIRR